jgi:hypothetical protein
MHRSKQHRCSTWRSNTTQRDRQNEAASNLTLGGCKLDWEVVKTFVSLDGRRRVEIVRRHDGFFSFEEDEWTSEFKKPCWVPAAHHGVVSIFDSAETAEREARARVDWLREQSQISN